MNAIESHPYIAGILLLITWVGMYRAGVNDARKACRAAFERHMGARS